MAERPGTSYDLVVVGAGINGVGIALDAALRGLRVALVESVPTGTRPPYLDAHVMRLRARIEGDSMRYTAAAERFRKLDLPFWLAVTQLEHAELLGDGDEAHGLRAEAREVFERLGAVPWVERTDRVRAQVTA